MPPQKEAPSETPMAHPIAFRGERDFIAEIEHLQPRLDMESADWDTRMVAMQRLEGLVLGAKDAGVSPATLEGLIRPLMEGIASNLHDGRSRIVRQGCHLIGVLATNMPGGFDTCADILLPDLLKLVPQSIAVIADSAHEATLQIVINCYPTRLLPRILREIRTSRSAPLRMRCAEYVHHAIVQWSTHPRNPLSGSLMEDIEAFIAASVNDGTREVRAEARQCFRDFCKLWPHREDALRRRFDPAVLKVLAHEDKAMGSARHSMFQLPAAQDAPRGASPVRPRSPILSRNAVNAQQLVSLQQAAQAMAKRRRQSGSAAMGTVSGPLHVPPARSTDDMGRSEGTSAPKSSFSGPLVFPVDGSRNSAGASGVPQAAAGLQPQVHLGPKQPPIPQLQQQQQVQPVMIRQLSFNSFRAAAGGLKAGAGLEEGSAAPSRNFWRLGLRGDDSPSKGGANPTPLNTSSSISSREDDSPGKSTAPTNRTLHSLFDKVGERSAKLEGEGRAGLAMYRVAEPAGLLASGGEVEGVRRTRGKSLGGDALGILGFSRTRKLAENLGLEGVSLSGRHGQAMDVPTEGQHVQAAPARMDLQSIKENLGAASAGHNGELASANALAEAARKVHQGSKGPAKGQGNEGGALAHPGIPLKALFSSNMAPALGDAGVPGMQRGRAEEHRGGGSPLRALLPSRGTSPLRLWRRDGVGKEKKEAAAALLATRETKSRDVSPKAGSRRASMVSALEGRRGSSAVNSRANSRETSPTKGRPPAGEGWRAGGSLGSRQGMGENKVVPTWAMPRVISHSGYDTENSESEDISACSSFKEDGSVHGQHQRGEKGDKQEMGLAQVLHAAKKKEDWEGRVKAITALQQLVLKHRQAGSQPGPTALDLPPPATKAASARFAADLARSMEQVLEMVAGSIEFQNHKVAGAALYCLEDIIRNFRDATEGHLDKYLPALFTRAVDPKQPLREQACDLLGLVQGSFSRETVLAAAERTVERHRVPKAKARAVEFGNEIVQAAALGSVDNGTVKVVRQWGQRLLQLAAEDAKARSEATKGAVLCADIVGINFIVAHFQGMPHSTMQEIMAGIAKASPEVNDRVAKALKESHGGSRSGPGPWDVSSAGLGTAALGAQGTKEARDKGGEATSGGQAVKHSASQREPPAARRTFGASKSGPISQERREGSHQGRTGAGGGRALRDCAPGAPGAFSRQSRDSTGPQRHSTGASVASKAAGVSRASTGAGPGTRGSRAPLGSRSGELGRTQAPSGGLGMGSKSGEMPWAASLKSASESGVPGSRNSSAARRSTAGVPGDARMRGAKSGELPGPRGATAAAAAEVRPAAGSARGMPGRRVSVQGPAGTLTLRSQPLNASGVPLAESATDSEWFEMEGTDVEEGSNSGRHATGSQVEGRGVVPRSRSQPLIHGAPADAAEEGEKGEQGDGGTEVALLGWLDPEKAAELGESFDAESHQGQADGVPALDTESQLDWEAGEADRGRENVLPGAPTHPLAHPDIAGDCAPESVTPAPEPATAEALLLLQHAPPQVQPVVESEEAAGGAPVSQPSALPPILRRGNWAQEAGEAAGGRAGYWEERGSGEPEAFETVFAAALQGKAEEERGIVAGAPEGAGWIEGSLNAQGVEDSAHAVAVPEDASGLRPDAAVGGDTEGVSQALSLQGSELEGEATHGVPQELPHEEEAEGKVGPGVHPQVLRQALSSLECSPMKGLLGRTGQLGDRLGLGRGLECSPMKGLLVQIPGDDDEDEGEHMQATGGQGEEGVAAGGGGGEGEEEGEEFPWTPVSDLPDTFGSTEKGAGGVQPRLWTGQKAAEKGGLAVAFGTLAVHQEDEREDSLLPPGAHTGAQGPEVSGTVPSDHLVPPPCLPERTGARSGYAGRMMSRELVMAPATAAGPSSGPFPFSQSQGAPLSRGDSLASADMYSCASSLRSPSCGDLTPNQGSITPPVPTGVLIPKGKAIPRSQSEGLLGTSAPEGGVSLQSPAHDSQLFLGTPRSETDMGSCLISPSGELHPELMRAAAQAANTDSARGQDEASDSGFSLPGNITPDQLKSPRDILAAAAMILQASQKLQQHQMQMQTEADTAPEQDGALEQQGQAQGQAFTGRCGSVPTSLRNSGDLELQREPGAVAAVVQGMVSWEEGPATVQGQGQGGAANGAPQSVPKLRRAMSGNLQGEASRDQPQSSTTPLGRSNSTSRSRKAAEEEGATGSRFTPSPALPSRFMPSPTHTARQSGGSRRSSSSFRLPHSQSCSSGMADLSLSGGNGSVTPPGRMSRSSSEEKGNPDEDTVRQLASNITDYYIALELENKLDKNEEHDDRTSLGRIHFVLENFLVF